jgi:hypothetical protein
MLSIIIILDEQEAYIKKTATKSFVKTDIVFEKKVCNKYLFVHNKNKWKLYLKSNKEMWRQIHVAIRQLVFFISIVHGQNHQNTQFWLLIWW